VSEGFSEDQRETMLMLERLVIIRCTARTTTGLLLVAALSWAAQVSRWWFFCEFEKNCL